MSPQIFEALDFRWLHLFVYQLVFPVKQDGHIILACMAALQGAGS